MSKFSVIGGESLSIIRLSVDEMALVTGGQTDPKAVIDEIKKDAGVAREIVKEAGEAAGFIEQTLEACGIDKKHATLVSYVSVGAGAVLVGGFLLYRGYSGKIAKPKAA